MHGAIRVRVALKPRNRPREGAMHPETKANVAFLPWRTPNDD
jgi:hypothetical protein